MVVVEFADPVRPIVEVRKLGVGIGGARDEVVQVSPIAGGGQRDRRGSGTKQVGHVAIGDRATAGVFPFLAQPLRRLVAFVVAQQVHRLSA
ncbi:hypothetical protein [Amycolatopsis sp. NBC_01480]|uniref:hypothetical protein n=1 Tax=Amycolatopsis sp. NBC_01480 TaxID=2903562 RepID=UPI002E27E39E|nr:hypothetical protein [Amycolatopsis sp. NBC_01480]